MGRLIVLFARFQEQQELVPIHRYDLRATN